MEKMKNFILVVGIKKYIFKKIKNIFKIKINIKKIIIKYRKIKI